MKKSFYKFLILSIIILLYSGCEETVIEPTDLGIPINDNEEIIIISPSSGDIFEPGDLLKIRWLSSSSLNKVDIFLLRNNTIVHTFALDQNNNGTYGWFIDDDVDVSSSYSIKVVNSFDDENFSISERFSIKQIQRIKIRP